MEERNVLKPVDVVIDSRGEVGEGVDGEVDEDETCYHVYHHASKTDVSLHLGCSWLPGDVLCQGIENVCTAKEDDRDEGA